METFDKYKYYKEAVQSPENDVMFFDQIYKQAFGKEAETLREDFCGTFSICCEWVKLSQNKKSIGVDLDQEPIKYGYETNFVTLTEEQKTKVKILEQNVLSPELPMADIVAALNFSYFLFKERQQLKDYFANVYKTLNTNSLFVLDCFGGPATQEANEEETEHEGFSYFWDQKSFNPITNYANYSIHFKIDGQEKIEDAFTYDWRMWSLAELQDILKEVGFQDVHALWEADGDDGEGNGEFYRAEVGQDCEAWVAYLVGKKI
jgi:cyclopropane fatty-acyl-phospholipid synthase-like methyltransferase